MTYSSVIYKKFNSQRRFGIELEMSNTLSKLQIKSILKQISHYPSKITKYELSGNNYYWHIKDDSTCGPFGRGSKGVEIASFIGKGVIDLKHIADVAEKLHNAGCRVNKYCGLHIHAEANDLTTRQMGAIVAYWIKIEDILSMALPEIRWNNAYCVNISDKCSIDLNKKWTALGLWNKFKPTNIGYYSNSDKRFNINFVNYARALYFKSNYRKTIELRWPEGTLNGSDIKCWTRLFLNFIETCKDLPMPENLQPSNLNEALSYLGMNHEDKSFVILSEGMHSTKTWLLERIVQCDKNEKLMNFLGHPVISVPQDNINSAKNVLNSMWNPIKNYV